MLEKSKIVQNVKQSNKYIKYLNKLHKKSGVILKKVV